MIVKTISKISLLSALLALNIGCWPYKTTNEYSQDFRIGYSVSKPIYLSIRNTRKNTLYLLLERNMNLDKLYIKVRWMSKNKSHQFKKEGSLLRFLLNKEHIINLTPLRPARISSYHIDPPAIEEECIYEISRNDLARISQADTVTMELEGITENKIATFNSQHTFKAFKDFLTNS
ncbi:MAG: hypothetical protein SFT68_03760 [Rickettsiaceae bacterium]|nr:hypothetical protein [Rickettsiaceae bacterium]